MTDSEPPTEKWALSDVADNNTRGSSQRLREKKEKIRQVTHCPSSESDLAGKQMAQKVELRVIEELESIKEMVYCASFRFDEYC